MRWVFHSHGLVPFSGNRHNQRPPRRRQSAQSPAGFTWTVTAPEPFIWPLSGSAEKQGLELTSMGCPPRRSCREWPRPQRRDFIEMQFHKRPLRRAQHHKSYTASCKVLLVTHVLIGCQKHVETGSFGLGLKGSGNAARCYVIKENEHRPFGRRESGQKAARRGFALRIRARLQSAPA
jgi:hypothetical protein